MFELMKFQMNHVPVDLNIYMVLSNWVGIAQWLECQIERLQVQLPAGAAEKISSPGSTSCADSDFVIHSTPMLLQ